MKALMQQEDNHTAFISADAPIIVGRDGRMVDVVISHPTVSRRHARVARRGGTLLVQDLRSSYGTFVNGRPTQGEAAVGRGDVVGFGSVRFVCDGRGLLRVHKEPSTLAMCCLGVGFDVRDRTTRRPLTLLTDVWLGIRPQELVCIIGPSGSGKSTLLSILSGRLSPTKGRVLYGGRDLHQEMDALKHEIAFVPQKEAVHAELTVSQALWYSAGLRLPSDTASAELVTVVDELLEEVGLREKRHLRIRELSGGQLKRVGLANELAHRPSMVFLDEVTSGLDELGDAEMMRLFRGLADRGRSVVCITHNTLNIERHAHLVVVLATGGRLACIGSPLEVCRHFGISRLGDVYAALDAKPAATWEAAFLAGGLRRRYLDERIPQGAQATEVSGRVDGFRRVSSRRPVRFSRQFSLLCRRIAQLQAPNPQAVMVAAVQAGFIGVMLSAHFGDLASVDDPATRMLNSRNAAFLMLVSVFWLGCNNAAPEIVKERVLYERERLVSVNAIAYYLAKVVVLGTLAIAQATVVYGMMSWWCGFPTEEGLTGPIKQAFTVWWLAILGTLTGLAVSSQSSTEMKAVRTVPIVLIPQIVLSDVIAELGSVLEWVAALFISTYWAVRAFTSGVAAYAPPGETPPGFTAAAAALTAHMVVLVAIAVAGLVSGRHREAAR